MQTEDLMRILIVTQGGTEGNKHHMIYKRYF